MSNELFIMVVSFNTCEKTRRCLQCLVAHTDRPYQIGVVDNASTDGSWTMLQEFARQYPNRIVILRNPSNYGYTRAVANLYPLLTPGSDLCHVNSDVYVGPAWASRLQQHLYREPSIAAVAPVAHGIGGWQDFQIHHASNRPDHYPNQYDEAVVADINQRVRDICPSAITAKSLQGTIWMIKRDAYERLGPLDTGCECGADDADWSLRARVQGWKLLVAFNTFVWHDDHSSFSTMPDRGERWIDRSWSYFNHKWTGQFDHLSWSDLMENTVATSFPRYQYEEFCP